MTAKKAFKPVAVATQVHQHQLAIKNWKPVGVATQVAKHKKALAAAHKKALAAAAVAKKHPQAAKHAKAKKHGLALSPDDVACCVAQAVAESLRLALGVAVADEDVLGLHWAADGDPDAGASLVDVLWAAHDRGLAGHQLRFAATVPDDLPCILGIDWPQPHAVLATPDGWWSWRELYEPWDAPITEAWEVAW